MSKGHINIENISCGVKDLINKAHIYNSESDNIKTYSFNNG